MNKMLWLLLYQVIDLVQEVFKSSLIGSGKVTDQMKAVKPTKPN